jgi:RNA polymerase sigma-54 factor
MLEQNPFLEAEEEAAPAFEPLAERLTSNERAGERESERAAEPGGDSADAGRADRRSTARPSSAQPSATIGRTAPSATTSTASAKTPGKTRTNNDFDEIDDSDRDSATQSLQDHLRGQLSSMRLSDADAAAVLVLIDSLDDEGYLADSLEDIAERLKEGGLTFERDAADACDDEDEPADPILAQLRCGLRFLQSMEPTGVGARDLAECLTLQLRTLPRGEAQAIAIIVCKSHLPLLARRDLKKLMAVTGADENLLREAQALIVALEPKPGRPFARAEANIVVPDVIVQKSGPRLEGDAQPRRDAEAAHQRPLRQRDPHQRGAGGRGMRSTAPPPGLNSRLQEARWFVKNILQRFDTIQRVSQAIVERQKSFFTHGAIAMKPLVLREIADELGLHESTISRVTTAKYMATPFGTFELKYFFGSSLATEAGGNASSTAVRALIRQIVGAEDPAKPLSDSQISLMLEEQGIHVARRTVAKYREALKIAPTQLRKTM